MTATYTKLKSGDWGIRVIGAISPGSLVVVTKKDGRQKDEVVDKVLFRDSAQNVTLCSIKQRESKRGSCGCDCGECSRKCRCEPHCVCRGGNVYDC